MTQRRYGSVGWAAMMCGLLLGCGDDSGPAGVPCESSATCAAGERCFNGFCVPGAAPDAGPGADAARDASRDGATDAAPTDAAARDASAPVDAARDATGGAIDGGTDAASPECVDIVGDYSICDGDECRDAVCYLSTVEIRNGGEPCTFQVESTGAASVNGTFTVTGDQVSPSGASFTRDGRPEVCGVGQVTTDGGVQIAFPCDCTFLLVGR